MHHFSPGSQGSGHLYMTTDQLRTEALAQFAKMTRHKPQALNGLFTCEVREGNGDLGDAILLTYGRRRAAVPLPEGWQDAEPAQFAQDVLKPAAAALYGSVD